MFQSSFCTKAFRTQCPPFLLLTPLFLQLSALTALIVQIFWPLNAKCLKCIAVKFSIVPIHNNAFWHDKRRERAEKRGASWSIIFNFPLMRIKRAKSLIFFHMQPPLQIPNVSVTSRENHQKSDRKWSGKEPLSKLSFKDQFSWQLLLLLFESCKVHNNIWPVSLEKEWVITKLGIELTCRNSKTHD